jgi:hypothetical protein
MPHRGTADVLVTDTLLSELLTKHRDQIRVNRATMYDDGGKQLLYAVNVSSDALRAGYHGVQEMFIRDGKVHFRQEADT